MTNSKVASIKTAAQKSYTEGKTVFLARYWDEVMTFQGTGEIAGGSQAIEEVESVGWVLKDIAYSWVERKNRGLTVMVFRRK